MPAQERTQERNRRITRRAVVVALLAATATAAIFLIKQDARGSSAAAVGGTDAIVGGEDAPNDQFPWMVSLQMADEEDPDDDPAGHFCGGTLIRPDTVLTAAHCFDDDICLLPRLS